MLRSLWKLFWVILVMKLELFLNGRNWFENKSLLKLKNGIKDNNKVLKE